MQRSQLAEKQRGEGLGSLIASGPSYRAGLASLANAGNPAHINAREDQLLAEAMPEAHGPSVTRGALAEAGRGGDDRLTLLIPAEAALLREHGGSGAINPATGEREFEDDSGTGNPGGGHNADGPASNGGYGGGGVSSSPGDGPSSRGGGIGPGGFFSEGEDLAKESTIGYANLGNPEMGGGIARSRGLASVDALGPPGSAMRNVNAASSVMAGYDPSFSDRAKDAFGVGAPGGFWGSPAANAAVGIAGTLVGGPAIGGLASLAHNIGVRGVDATKATAEAVGGALAGLPGAVVGHYASNAITGREDYDSPMTENDRQRRNAELDAAEKNGTAVASATAGATPGTSTGADTGAGAGTNYVMAPPEAAAPAARTQVASAAPDGWDENGFLTRHPEVAKAVQKGTWTSGYAFNNAYRKTAGASYDAAKAIGVVDPYNDETLETRPGQAVPWRA